jgi:hypothetical protein
VRPARKNNEIVVSFSSVMSGCTSFDSAYDIVLVLEDRPWRLRTLESNLARVASLNPTLPCVDSLRKGTTGHHYYCRRTQECWHRSLTCYVLTRAFFPAGLSSSSSSSIAIISCVRIMETLAVPASGTRKDRGRAGSSNLCSS